MPYRPASHDHNEEADPKYDWLSDCLCWPQVRCTDCDSFKGLEWTFCALLCARRFSRGPKECCVHHRHQRIYDWNQNSSGIPPGPQALIVWMNPVVLPLGLLAMIQCHHHHPECYFSARQRRPSLPSWGTSGRMTTSTTSVSPTGSRCGNLDSWSRWHQKTSVMPRNSSTPSCPLEVRWCACITTTFTHLSV